jgi:hydroxyethylthiazole kinase-like uncharacterized protein yjeF
MHRKGDYAGLIHFAHCLYMKKFNPEDLKLLYKPRNDSVGEQNGQVTIIGGSKLFHGAPLLALKVASRIVDMVFFASPEPSVGAVAERMKLKLFSFIWVPWEETENYVEKSDAILIGPGLMRYRKEGQKSEVRGRGLDSEGERTRKITESLLKKSPSKRWVIDAGSLQVMDADWIPEQAVLTPNKKEFELLFNAKCQMENAKLMARKHKCIIVAKGPETIVCQPAQAGSGGCIKVTGGNPGMTKGGTGDVLAGLTVGLLAKNSPFLASCAASYIAKKAGDALHSRVGTNYNADDLADEIPKLFGRLLKEN